MVEMPSEAPLVVRTVPVPDACPSARPTFVPLADALADAGTVVDISLDNMTLPIADDRLALDEEMRGEPLMLTE